MIVVAITGGIASGKSFCISVFRERGFKCISADIIAHEIANTTIAREKIESAFGTGYYVDNTLDRKKLGKFVFADKTRLEKLNSIMHKLIYDRMQELIKEYSASEKLIAIEIPLLYETNMQGIADCVINCWVPEEVQLERLLQRDGISSDEAKARMNSQLPTETKKALADYNVDSRMSFEDTRVYVNNLINIILNEEING